MKEKIRYSNFKIFSLLLGMVVFSCTGVGSGNKNISDSLRLSFGDFNEIEGTDFKIALTDIKSESRCPSDVVCVWQGVAEAEFTLVAGESDTTRIIIEIFGYVDTENGEPRFIDKSGYRWTLQQLDPYPVSTTQTQKEDYVALLKVEENSFSRNLTDIQIIDNWIDAGFAKDPLTILATDIKNDSLYISTRYGGGCKEHTFALFSTAAFMESFPVQVDVKLYHDSDGDACKALVNTNLAFNLKPLKKKFQEYYSSSGTMIIRLWDASDTVSFGHTINYVF